MQKAAGKVNWDDVGVCQTLRKTYGLDSRQARICKTWRPVMQHVSRAAALAVVACQTVLQNRRWNCSSARTAPSLTPELVKGGKTRLFSYFLSAAPTAPANYPVETVHFAYAFIVAYIYFFFNYLYVVIYNIFIFQVGIPNIYIFSNYLL